MKKLKVVVLSILLILFPLYTWENIVWSFTAMHWSFGVLAIALHLTFLAWLVFSLFFEFLTYIADKK